MTYKNIKICSGFDDGGVPTFSSFGERLDLMWEHYEPYTGQKPDWMKD